jgi:protein-disulfide isomerase
MLARLAAVSVVAVLSLSPPQSQADEIAALKREVAELKAQQAAMQRDLQAIKNFLQNALQPRQQQPAAGEELPGVIGQSIPLAGEPSMGNAGAKVTLVEVSDYHCPFCRRNALQTFPQVNTDYVATGKVRYVFVDYPIAQLHPDAFKSHEAADCAGDQGKYWEMHTALFKDAPAKDAATLTARAQSIGLDTAKFSSCLSSERHAPAIKDSIARMEKLGIGGTPATLIGLTPKDGGPMQIVGYVYGAKPYTEFKTQIDAALAKAQ